MNNTENEIIFIKGYCTLIKNADDTLWGFGYNDNGNLGDINLGKFISKPIKITDNVKMFKKVGGGTLILKNDNTLWGCGDNLWGQLGEINIGKVIPKLTKIMEHVKLVITQHQHTFVIKDDNTLWAFGNNAYGQLGINENNTNNTFNIPTIPTKIMDHVKTIVVNPYKTFVIKEDNTLWGFGSIFEFKETKIETPIKIMDHVKNILTDNLYSVIIKEDNTMELYIDKEVDIRSILNES